MKKVIQQFYGILLILMMGVLVFSCRSTREGFPVSRESPPMVSRSTLIIYYDAKVGKESLLKAVKINKAEVIYDYVNFHAIAIRISPKKSIKQAKAFFEKVRGVLLVNGDQIILLDEKE